MSATDRAVDAPPVKTRLARGLDSPFLRLGVGLVLLASAAFEIWEGLEEFRLGAHHGLLVFGVYQIVGVLPELWEGLEQIEEAVHSEQTV